eukprot:5428584-Amphidinium_carterae.1
MPLSPWETVLLSKICEGTNFWPANAKSLALANQCPWAQPHGQRPEVPAQGAKDLAYLQNAPPRAGPAAPCGVS